MKFIIDAQLPPALSKYLTSRGFDAIHTDDMPMKELTTDNEIREIALKEDRIVITKDSDFLDSYYISSVPKKLLLISTGNIKNKHLLSLFESSVEKILELFNDHSLIEMDNIEILVHE